MKSFFRTIRQSLYAPAFYKSIPGQNFSQGLFYMLALCCLSMLAAALIFFLTIDSPFTKDSSARLVDRIVDVYPDELVLSMEQGSLSTNLQEPYFILVEDTPFNASWLEAREDYENFLVINTSEPFSIEAFNGYNTLALLSDDGFSYLEDGQIEIIDFAGEQDFVLEKEKIESFVDEVRPFLLPGLIFIGFCLYILVTVFYYMWNLIYCLFAAFLIWGMSVLTKQTRSYEDAYKISLYGMTSVLLVMPLVVLLMQFTGFEPFLFFYSIIFFAFVVANLMPRKKV